MFLKMLTKKTYQEIKYQTLKHTNLKAKLHYSLILEFQEHATQAVHLHYGEVISNTFYCVYSKPLYDTA